MFKAGDPAQHKWNCLNDISAAVNMYEISSNANKMLFLLDSKNNVLCVYSQSNGVTMPCNDKACNTRDKIMVDEINKFSSVDNIHFVSQDFTLLSFDIDGLNETDELENDLIDTFEEVGYTENETLEYYSKAGKVHYTINTSFDDVNASGVSYYKSGDEATWCMNGNDSKKYCTNNPEQFEVYSIADYLPKLSSKLFNNKDVTIYSYTDNGFNCINISTYNYVSIYDVFENKDLVAAIGGFTSYGKVTSFNMNISICLENKVLVDYHIWMDMKLNISYLEKELTLSMFSDYTSLYYDENIPEGIFSAPEGVYECQEPCKAKKCFEEDCSASTLYSCSYYPKDNCCGNEICEAGESLSGCVQDCIPLSEAIADKTITEMIPYSFYYDDAVIGEYTSEEGDTYNIDYYNTGKFKGEGAVADYWNSEGTMKLMSLYIYKAETYVDFKKLIDLYNTDYQDSVNILKYTNLSFMWRDSIVHFNLGNWNSYCVDGTEGYFVGYGYVELPKEMIVIEFSPTECLSYPRAKDIVADMFEQIADGEADDSLTVYDEREN
jgi:hypothetical protein